MKFKVRILHNNYIGGFGVKSCLLDAPADLTFSLREGIYIGSITKDRSIFHVLFYFGPVPTLGISEKKLEMIILDLGIEYLGVNDIIECEIKNYIHGINIYERIEYLVRDTEEDKRTIIEKYLYQ